jgi:hypothetical protein
VGQGKSSHGSAVISVGWSSPFGFELAFVLFRSMPAWQPKSAAVKGAIPVPDCQSVQFVGYNGIRR